MRQIIVDNISTWYYINPKGECYNSKTGKWLKGQINYKNGYKTYYITLPCGKKKRIFAHRAVALAYIPNNSKQKNQINHIDGNKLNNSVDNLEWCTQTENQQHAIKNHLRVFPHVYCFSKDKRLVAEYNSLKEASRSTGVSQSEIEKELLKPQVLPKELVKNFYWSRNPSLGETKKYPNLGKAKEVNQYTKDGKYIMTYPSCGAAGRAMGAKKASAHISECCRGKLKTYKGFIWRYTNDIVLSCGKSQGINCVYS